MIVVLQRLDTFSKNAYVQSNMLRAQEAKSQAFSTDI